MFVWHVGLHDLVLDVVAEIDFGTFDNEFSIAAD